MNDLSYFAINIIYHQLVAISFSNEVGREMSTALGVNPLLSNNNLAASYAASVWRI